MIEAKIAQKEISRLAQLERFPVDHNEALKELIKALQTSATKEIAAATIDDFIADQSTRKCPLPADIRATIARLSEKETERRRGCAACRGTGFIVSWWLISRESQKPTRREKLEGVLNEDSLDGDHARSALIQRLGADQEVISAARMCECHPGRAKEPAA